MSKSARIFVAVLYFLLVSAFGIFVAIALPYDMINRYPFEIINEALDTKDYERAIRLVAAYYDSDIVYQSEENGYGVVIYASTILEANEEGVDDAIIQKAYSGFIYNISNKDAFYLEDNKKPFVRAFNSSSEVYEFDVLNCDTDNDNNPDYVYTLIDYDYYFFNFKQEKISKITNLAFFDNTESSFHTIANLNLDFSESFFQDVDAFVNEYNQDYNSSNLSTLDQEFRNKDASYKMANYQEVNDKKNDLIKKACILVLIYFIAAYALGDIVVGKRYIIKLVQKIIQVIRKKKNKDQPLEKVATQDVYTDYYTQVTFKLKVPPTCDTSFVITYKNEKYEMEFRLTKIDGYQETKRIHAGRYSNAWVECGKYQAVDFPKEVEIKGFKKLIEVEFVDKLDEDDEYGK